MSQAWREVQAIVLNRDNHRCRECNELCTKGDADVHHLVPRAVGGMDERSAVMVVKRHNAGFCCERTARRFVLR